MRIRPPPEDGLPDSDLASADSSLLPLESSKRTRSVTHDQRLFCGLVSSQSLKELRSYMKPSGSGGPFETNLPSKLSSSPDVKGTNVQDSGLKRTSKKIRVSFGSATVLGLLRGRLDVLPTTMYFLTYKDGRCQANCSFCPQARGSHSRLDMLSRVSWPAFPVHDVVEHLAKAAEECRIERVCLQALNYRDVFSDLLMLVGAIS